MAAFRVTSQLHDPAIGLILEAYSGVIIE